jgi:hypothetical protein
MRRPGAAAAALAAVLALGGCSSGGQDPSDGDAPRTRTQGATAADHRAALRTLLERRADALARGRADALADTAAGDQRGRDRLVVRQGRGVPLRGARYEVEGVRLRGREAVLRTRLAYRVRGIRGEFSVARRLVAERGGDGWRVRREGGRRDRLPWELEPYASYRTEHFLALAPVSLELGALPEVLEQGYARLAERLDRPRLRDRYLVVVARSAPAARRLTSFIRGTSSLVAITDAKVRDDGPARQVTEVVGLRLLVVMGAFATLPYEEQVRVITHELVHAALVRRTSGRTPAWLNEGVALYLSDDRRVAQAAELVGGEAEGEERRSLTLAGLSVPDAIARLAGDRQTAAYAYASSAAHYIADRFGEERLLALYAAFNDSDIPGRGGRETTDLALREVLGRSLDELELDLRRWIVTRVVVAPYDP